MLNIEQLKANRLRRLPPYIFAVVNKMKMDKRRQGQDVIDFVMGNPDIPTPKHIVDKMKAVADDPKTHRYSASKGIAHLRRAISQRYKTLFDVDIDPETEAITVIGSKEGIAHLALSIIDQGDIALVPNPTYPIHTYGIYLAGGDVIYMPITEENNYLPDFESAYKQSWPKPKVMILNYPHNPTTATAPLEFFERVVHFAKQNNVLIIHDMAYSDITFDGYVTPSFLQIKGAKDIGIEFFTLSKTYSMAGWRLGFCVGNKKVIELLTHIKSYLDYGIFTPIQVAGIVALTGDQSCVEEIRKVYQTRRDLLCSSMNDMGWPITPPKAGMFLWAKLPEAFREMGSIDFSLKLLEEANVALSPGFGFGRYGENYIRLAMVENEDRIRQALRSMKKFLKSYGV